MKKRISLLLMLIVPTMSLAANRLTIENSAITVRKMSPPDTGKLYISLQNDRNVNGMNFIIQFDSSLITPLQIRPLLRAAALSNAEAYRFAPDKISFVVYGKKAKQIEIESGFGRIFEIKYVVVDTNITAETKTSVVFYESLIAGEQIRAIPFDYANGLITIYPDPTTGVAEKSELPIRFELFQNYPNPFNPTTTIKYALPAASKIKLRIFDMFGREVNTLVEGVQEAGYKIVEWNATNRFGQPVASGVYFYRIEATGLGNQKPSFVQIKRMLVLK